MKNLILVLIFSLFAVGSMNAQEEIKAQIETTVEEVSKKEGKPGCEKACCATKADGKIECEKGDKKACCTSKDGDKKSCKKDGEKEACKPGCEKACCADKK